MSFARALNENLYKIFQGFGAERVTRSSHLEKLCLIRGGVGRDNISDFATNLIKEFLLEYTQTFTQKYIAKNLCHEFRVPRTRFNYDIEDWAEETFTLPIFKGDFVILTPKDLLTKDETWINRNDLLKSFDSIPDAVDNDALRSKANNYFQLSLSRYGSKPKDSEKKQAAAYTILRFPELIDHYIKLKEESGEQAESISNEKVRRLERIFVKNAKAFIEGLSPLGFFPYEWNSYDEAKAKAYALKEFIENNDGYKLFYYEGQRIRKESELHLLFRLVCHGSGFDVNHEVNNGRGAADFIISWGGADKTVVEFKLASNRKLKRNLQNQVAIYEEANNTEQSIKVVIYFTGAEYKKLDNLGLVKDESVVLIDARNDNKPSASNA